MKKLFIALGITFAALVLIGGSLIGIVAYKGSKLDASSKAYVDANIPVIVKDWSRDEFQQRASLKLRSVAPEEQWILLFNKLKSLGSLQEYGGSSGHANMSVTSQDGKVVSAYYLAKAKFKNGDADIKVTLLRENGFWKIVGFHVDSPFFLK